MAVVVRSVLAVVSVVVVGPALMVAVMVVLLFGWPSGGLLSNLHRSIRLLCKLVNTMTAKRPPLSRARVLDAAIRVADQGGLEALTMRRLGAELDVEAMSLYKHVDGKDDILDGMVDTVIAAIDVPEPGTEWRDAMRRRASSARSVLLRHSWAIALFEARGLNSAVTIGYADTILGCLREGGFDAEDAAHAFVLLDTFVYGHVIQEATTAREPDEDTEFDGPPPQYLMEVQELAAEGRFSHDTEFDFGLELFLEALAQRL